MFCSIGRIALYTCADWPISLLLVCSSLEDLIVNSLWLCETSQSISVMLKVSPVAALASRFFGTGIRVGLSLTVDALEFTVDAGLCLYCSFLFIIDFSNGCPFWKKSLVLCLILLLSLDQKPVVIIKVVWPYALFYFGKIDLYAPREMFLTSCYIAFSQG